MVGVPGYTAVPSQEIREGSPLSLYLVVVDLAYLPKVLPVFYGGIWSLASHTCASYGGPIGQSGGNSRDFQSLHEDSVAPLHAIHGFLS